MRKAILLLSCWTLLLTACQKEELPPESGQQITKSLSVIIPQEHQTRASTFGDGSKVNRCILEIYIGENLYLGPEYVQMTNGKASFEDLPFISSQTYTFVLWADHVDDSSNEQGLKTDKHYTTGGPDGLKAITRKGTYVSHDDNFDAFTAVLADQTVDASFTKSITLKRPFGLLTVKTDDLASLTSVNTMFIPNRYQINFVSVPSTFNAKTGDITEDRKSFTYDITDFVNGADGTLSADYLFATNTELNTLIDFNIDFYRDNSKILTNDSFKNIPIRANYKTNVSGNFITKTGSITTSMISTFQKTIDQPIIEVNSIADIPQAILDGHTNIVVNETPGGNQTIALPKTSGSEISITLPELGPDDQLTIEADGNSGSGNIPANVNITTPKTENLTINLPDSKVTLNGIHKNVNVVNTPQSSPAAYTVSPVAEPAQSSSFILSEGSRITGTLTLDHGNAEIYGELTGPIVFGAGNESATVKAYTVYNRATLDQAASLISANRCSRLLLGKSIDMSGGNWTPLQTAGTAFTEMDGQGHTLSNMTVNNQAATADNDYGGFFYTLQGTVRNVSFNSPNMTVNRGGVLAGRYDGGHIENCRVSNAHVKGVQKIGGLLGYVNLGTALTIENCSVSNCEINSLEPGKQHAQSGGLIGYLAVNGQDIRIRNNATSRITILNASTLPVEQKYYLPADHQRYYMETGIEEYSHAFIGNICNYSKSRESTVSIILENNTVANQCDDIPISDRRTATVGWWVADYNIIYTSNYNVFSTSYSIPILEDGKYYDRNKELHHLIDLLEAGGEVYILSQTEIRFDHIERAIDITRPTTLNVISANASAAMFLNRNKINIKGNGRLTINHKQPKKAGNMNLGIIDSNFNGRYYFLSKEGFAIENNGLLEINNGRLFEGPGNLFVVETGGQLVINGCRWLKSTDYDGNVITNHGTAEILNIAGEMYSSGVDVLVNSGSLTIRDSKITCKGDQSVVKNSGTLNISTEKNKTYLSSSAGPVISNEGSGILHITGGYFSDNKAPLEEGYHYVPNSDPTYPWKVEPVGNPAP